MYGVNWILAKVILGGIRNELSSCLFSLYLDEESIFIDFTFTVDNPLIVEFVMKPERRLTMLDSID